jgi:D-alanine-D-alanine ligase
MMKNKKIRLGILFGGKSAEHEVSLISAKNIIEALDPQKYDVFLIGIDKTGEWRLRDGYSYLMNADNPQLIQLHETENSLALVPKHNRKELVSCCGNQLQESLQLDVIFPVLHGTYGEDGTVQGLLKLANIPFVGAGVLGSAVGMDKDVMKRLLRDAKIPIANFLTLYDYNIDRFTFEAIVREIGLPFFVKPANLGSSVGISKVKNKEGFEAALKNAFLYDRKILIEEFILGREIVCSVLGNDAPIVSLPGEIIPNHEFYSYEAKYLDKEGANYKTPVDLPTDVIEKIQQTAMDSYRVLCCEGMARLDLFLKENGDLVVNEINTIPGFTKISMYPKLWIASGLSYTNLLDRLIELAVERHAKESQLKTTF